VSDWKKEKCCGTCRHWNIEDAKDKAGRVIWGARCDWPIPELPSSAFSKVIHKTFMARDLGKDCPTYAKREEV
jgi:hypothetical protein